MPSLPFPSSPALPPSMPHSRFLAEQGTKPSCGDLQKNSLLADFDPRQKQDANTGRLFERVGRWSQ